MTTKGFFERWLSGPVLLVPLVLLLGGAIYSLSDLSNATSWLRHTDQVRVAVGRLQSTMLAGETASRGYLVAGEKTFIEAYRSARLQWPVDLEGVRTLTDDNPDQQRRLQRVSDVLDERFKLSASALAAFDAGARSERLTPLMLRGQRLMDTARVTIDEMEREEARLDGARQQAATRRWQLTMVLFVSASFVSLVLISSVQFQRRAANARREHADEVNRAVDGERRVLQGILAGIDDGITLQDRSGKLVFANASAARLIGFRSPEALLAAPSAEIMDRFRIFDVAGAPMDLGQLPARQVLAGAASEASAIIRYRSGDARSDGTEDRWSHVRAYPVFGTTGELIQAINVFQDVTDERRTDERREFLTRAIAELNSSLDYHATLASVARLAVPILADWCAVDIVDEGRVKRVAIAHIDPEKLALVADIERRYPSDPDARTGVPEVIRTGEPLYIHSIPRELLQAAAKDAAHLDLIDRLQLGSFMGIPLKVGSKVIGAISLAMAESHRHHHREDLDFARTLADRAALAIENARLFLEVERSREALATQLTDETNRRREAEDASRFAETFVAILGHDLRNPLNAISMTATLLERKAIFDPEAVGRIKRSTQRMSSMVAQLLDLTRSRLAGGITIARRSIRVGSIVVDVLDEWRRSHPERSIRFEQAGDDTVLGDQDRLAQVISNLVGNAVEHGDASAPVIVTLGSNGGTLVLTIHNMGSPIPASLLPIIFDPFQRTTARGERARGLGLGLFITQQIVQAHGGTIEVTSSAEAGTMFTAHVPSFVEQRAPVGLESGIVET